MSTRVLHWSNYSAKAIALIQARGMPIDMALWNLVQENKAAVIGALMRQFDPSYGSDDPIYTPEGEWSYERFEQWLVRTGVAAWPRLDSGRLNIDSDAFRLMYHVPGIEGPARAARQPRLHRQGASCRSARTAATVLRCFRSAPQPAAMRTAKSPYNAHAGMRSFMVFPPDTIGFYLDWRTQEVGIAAASSGDQALMSDYLRGDIYHALARLCGLTDDPDPIRWKKQDPAAARSHEAAAAGHQLRHGRAVIGARPRSPPADRQRDHRAPQAPVSAVLAMARRHGADRHVAAAHRQRLRLAAAYQPPAPTSARSTIFPCKPVVRKCCDWRRGGYARPA